MLDGLVLEPQPTVDESQVEMGLSQIGPLSEYLQVQISSFL